MTDQEQLKKEALRHIHGLGWTPHVSRTKAEINAFVAGAQFILSSPVQELKRAQCEACFKTLRLVKDSSTGFDDKQKIELLTGMLSRLKKHVGMFLKADIDNLLEKTTNHDSKRT